MNGMMDGMSGFMFWGMGLTWVLVFALLALGVAALLKYLFRSDKRSNGQS
ncbi:MAG: hypothetical protein RJP95_02200 [Pirellulales bacterium]